MEDMIENQSTKADEFNRLERENLPKQLEDLKVENKILKKEVSLYAIGNEGTKTELAKLKQELEIMKEENEGLKKSSAADKVKTLKNQEEEVKRETENVKQMKATVANDTLTGAISNLKSSKTKTNDMSKSYDSRKESQIVVLKREVQTRDTRIQSLEEKCEELTKKIQKQQMEADKLIFEHQKTIVSFEETSGTAIDEIMKKELDSLKEIIKKQKINEAEMKSEIDRLRLSLSKVAGEKMLDGNPMITDLSDSNRPQKLSEKFNSLYDNSWTDAYEIVAKQTDDEKMVCGNLLTILKNCWEFCRNLSIKQLDTLKLLFISPDMKEENKQQHLENFPSRHSKLIQDTRRCFSQRFIPNLHQHYWQSTKSNEIEVSVQPYVEACLELCWHSAISDPPLDYDFTVENIDDFRGYTKSGDKIDYVVWPAMYLHKHGPLLYKGVIQFNTETN